jgi:hypothetical protein
MLKNTLFLSRVVGNVGERASGKAVSPDPDCRVPQEVRKSPNLGFVEWHTEIKGLLLPLAVREMEFQNCSLADSIKLREKKNNFFDRKKYSKVKFLPKRFDERVLYPYVEDFLKGESFGCFKTSQRVGTSFIGLADVVGVREVGGDVRGDIEVISVEVKSSTRTFGKILGQALGYSLFAHKCYLAVRLTSYKHLSLEQKELATRLGVGLIEIRKHRSGWKCFHILSSKNHSPHPHQMETLLRRGLGVIRCSFCGIFIDIEGEKITDSWDVAREKGKIYLMWRKPNRKLLFSRRRKEDWRRLYICKDCVEELWTGLALEESANTV